MELKNKVAVITGGSSGYGKGIAEVLKRNGSRVWILSSNGTKLARVASELEVLYAVCDITRPEDWDNATSEIIKQEGRIDILINNAGSGVAIKPLIEQTDTEIYDSIMINLVGHIYGIKRVGAHMCENKDGIIINISSICSEHAWPGWSVYSAAKAGIEMLARSLHNEFRKNNVRIVTVTPSWGATDFLKEAKLDTFPADIAEKVMKPVEMGELIVKVCTMPKHLIINKIRVQPMVQEINPM
ncbi:MAG: SDR family oxidoreductase [Actinobacteria bacterium]|nr:SDR family oxidoreductase [Actinomycetota bacterium]